MPSRITRTLLEAYDVSRAELGKVPFKVSDIQDRHIQEVIQAASKKTGVPADQIAAKIQKDIAEIAQMKQYSYLLYDTAAKNAAESAAFDLVAHVDNPAFTKFDPAIFFKLIDLVQLENEQFFPLRAPGEVNYVFDVNPILVPSNKKEFQKYNNIDTAAATAKGDFIFNRDFMQKLMDWAVMERLHPKGKKYESNGGPIPDNYAYIEFLIVHELLHYSYGDFTHGTRLSQYTPMEHNYASDFRSNYMLVKNGFDQLPIGLFSDHINADRQNSYHEMVDLVHNELKKMPKPLQDKFQQLASQLDDHASSESHSEGQGKPAGEVPSQDQIQKDIEGKLGRRQEIGSDKEAQEKAAQAAKGKAGGPPGSGVSRGGQMDAMTSREQEIAAVVPKFNWKTLIKQMISSSVLQSDVSYAKPSRRSVTGAVIARATGAAAVKPGEKITEQQQNKMMLVFDTSGSMAADIPIVLAEAQSLLKQMGRTEAPIGLCFFADQAKYYLANMSKDTWHTVEDVNEIVQNKPSGAAQKGWKKILGMASSGGTDFDAKLAGNLAELATAGFNVMIFSDEGINDADNFANFSKLYSSHKNHMFFVSNNLQNFRATCALMGQVPRNFSYLS